VLEIANSTVVIGGRILRIGRKIVSLALEFAKTIPNTLFGVAIALVLTTLIASVPIIGTLLAGFLKSILVIFGIAQGALADLREGELANRIDAFVAKVAALNEVR
jgi:hypothetical protein